MMVATYLHGVELECCAATRVRWWHAGREGVVDGADVLADVRESVVDKDPDVRNWVQ